MNKSIFGLILIVIIALMLLVSYLLKSRPTPLESNQEVEQPKVSLFENITNMCKIFPLEEVNKLTGKTFTKTQSFHSNDGKTYNCEYFLDNHFIIIDLGLYDVSDQKKGYAYLDRTISTDSRIQIEHFMVHSGKNPEEIIDIYLVLGTNSFVRIGKSSAQVMSNDELINLAQHMTAILQGTEAYKVPQISNKKTRTPTSDDGVPLPSAQSIGRTFLELIGEKDIDRALSMMSADMLGDEAQQQAWGVQFNAFESFVVTSMQDSLKETWTSDTQQFKAVIEVTMKPDAIEAPIPNYGWDNGENIRWIVMKKINGRWNVDAIATGP
ncbi:MAG: hypothetical protein NUV52_03335 [Candidatus Roizmanbacteria bacterium]|nr:hypothetical protein [Candidatus Roizmanbacteria bacterium]